MLLLGKNQDYSPYFVFFVEDISFPSLPGINESWI